MLTKRELIIFETGRLLGVGRPISAAILQAVEQVETNDGCSPFLTTAKASLELKLGGMKKEGEL